MKWATPGAKARSVYVLLFLVSLPVPLFHYRVFGDALWAVRYPWGLHPIEILAVYRLGGARASGRMLRAARPGATGRGSTAWRVIQKPPLSLSRPEYASGASTVTYHGKNPAAPGGSTVQYDPVAFLALILVHVPDQNEVRYCGAASSTIRRGGRKGRLARRATEDERGPDAPPDAEGAYVKARRRTWAQLLARVYAVDALGCGRCGGRMRIAFITDPEVVEILRHIGK